MFRNSIIIEYKYIQLWIYYDNNNNNNNNNTVTLCSHNSWSNIHCGKFLKQ